MAKKKSNANRSKQENSKEFTPKELLIHKYADFYTAKKEQKSELREGLNEEEAQDNFVLYDALEIFYPMYKSKIKYTVSIQRPLHPVIEQILKIIDELSRIKNINIIEKLQEITQLDSEIYESILNDLLLRGFLVEEEGNLALSLRAKQLLKEQNEMVKEETFAFVLIDGIFGRVTQVAKDGRALYLPDRAGKQGLELKPSINARPKTERLFDEFSDNKTLYQVLIAALQGLDDTEGNKCEPCDINEIIDVKKFFKPYFCLFYKSKEDERRILVIDTKLDIDQDATRLFDELLRQQGLFEASVVNINSQKEQLAKVDPEYYLGLDEETINKLAPKNALEEHKEKFKQMNKEKIEEILSLDLKERIIYDQEHPKFFRYALQSAKKMVCVHSPWIRGRVLRIYEKDLKVALERGVDLFFKYNMTPRNERDKLDLDSEAKAICQILSKDYPNFHLIKDETSNHSKILICDEAFMIVGSFNWLSYSGEDNRKETSALMLNKDSIKENIKEFKKG
ncbi:phospholipase D-like domain-containing protein [Campylobacter troglodytis]|uniref:phospholipase D-like domain-containing protein n=1 Tax=Campylobacter troglodytis TaxID=654363 RepID=UPI001157568C|nr:phospholipase D-like domain-containing protein [Campylobacter troglodytis]TQR59585.1 hypothetical protein DMC01_07335 [Campylobacter troglodytis]